MNPIDPTLPEVVQRFLASGAALESIRLDAAGNWWHQGGLFNNMRIAALFSRSIDRTAGGTWVLKIKPFTYPIEVEDTPYFVEKITFEGAGPSDPDERVSMSLSDESTEVLDPTTLTQDEGKGLSCAVKGGAFRARFKRPAYYALTERLHETEAGDFALEIAAARHPLR